MASKTEVALQKEEVPAKEGPSPRRTARCLTFRRGHQEARRLRQEARLYHP